MRRFVVLLAGMLWIPLASASLGDVRLPPGFIIEEYAEVPNARSLAIGDRGTLFVSTRRAGEVYAVVEDEDGATHTIELLAGMSSPNGIAFRDGDLYVAETDRVYEGARGRVTIEDPGWRRRIVVDKAGSATTVVWNPWVAKAKAMPDFGSPDRVKVSSKPGEAGSRVGITGPRHRTTR